MKMTNEERQALKEFVDEFLSDPAHDEKSLNSKTADVFRLALATLTAEPVAWEVKGILCHTKEEADKYVGTPVLLIESFFDNTAQQYEALAKDDKC